MREWKEAVRAAGLVVRLLGEIEEGCEWAQRHMDPEELGMLSETLMGYADDLYAIAEDLESTKVCLDYERKTEEVS